MDLCLFACLLVWFGGEVLFFSWLCWWVMIRMNDLRGNHEGLEVSIRERCSGDDR